VDLISEDGRKDSRRHELFKRFYAVSAKVSRSAKASSDKRMIHHPGGAAAAITARRDGFFSCIGRTWQRCSCEIMDMEYVISFHGRFAEPLPPPAMAGCRRETPFPRQPAFKLIPGKRIMFQGRF
jgi:hypothetical protein